MFAESRAGIGRDGGRPEGFAWHRNPSRLFTLAGTCQFQDEFSICNEEDLL